MRIMHENSRLDDALEMLDPQARQVMELWLRGISHPEAAKVLGLSERAFALVRRSTIEKVRRFLGEQPLGTSEWECN